MAPLGIRNDIPVINGLTPVVVIPLMVCCPTCVQLGLPSVPTVPLSEVELYQSVAVTPLKEVVERLPTSVSSMPPPLLFDTTKVTKLLEDVLVLPVYPVLPTVVFIVVCAFSPSAVKKAAKNDR